MTLPGMASSYERACRLKRSSSTLQVVAVDLFGGDSVPMDEMEASGRFISSENPHPS